ncbi:hypothetical protein CcCBS67573_g03915 [Chytriomyces confervae]|uniref:Bromo domain-containing protein n=1 Tax=Chytriomyces confervae TaxID=246404 RepID=A0A507FHH7_9FUNG|nr:hypothetical protein CcCBS67573_g03915 [Chytriomyces confervae]
MDSDDYDSDEHAAQDDDVGTDITSNLAISQPQPHSQLLWNPLLPQSIQLEPQSAQSAPIVISNDYVIQSPRKSTQIEQQKKLKDWDAFDNDSDSESNADQSSQKLLKFSDLFAPKLKFVKPQIKKTFKKASHRQGYVLSRNDVDVFLGRVSQPTTLTDSWGIYRARKWKEELEEREIFEDKVLPSSMDPVVLDQWEDKILWDDEEEDSTRNKSADAIKEAREEQSRLLIRNTALDSELWTDAIIWDDEDNFVPPPIIFNDPTIVNDLKNWATDETSANPIKRYQGAPVMDRFNLSNDMFYVNSHKREHVRQSQGSAILKHSRAAVEMLWPHYKTQLNTQELRDFHRPPIKFSPGEEAHFSRCKSAKKKRDTDPLDDYMNLTNRDTNNYVLLEYSEEYPPILSNFGMGTLLQNFYRKENEKDLTVPKLPIGQHSPLEKIDASPFNNFGDVSPGDVIQGITNNLIRAPIWQHVIPPTDFLLIRHTHNGKVKWYLRDVPFLFVVGQTYPQQEVPRPQSRKVLNLMKARLHSIAFRLMLNNANNRLWYENLKRYFADQPDSEVRARLREVAQNWKKGENTGWYKVKQSRVLPTEEELQKIITPEWCCLLEAAFAGEQRLKDIGYASLDLGAGGGGGGGEEGGEEQEDSSTDLEIQMAPWIWSKNFVMTIQGKGMVQLYGGGDPTGIGEGFSFIRQSMKEMFYREGEAPPKDAPVTPKNLIRFSYAEQQVVYKEEIRRIWNAQVKSLSSKKAVDLPTEEELGAEDDLEDDKRDDMNEDKLLPQIGPIQPKDDDAISIAGSVESSAVKKNRKLIINRLVRGPNGQMITKSETISDPRVINAYLREAYVRKQKKEQDALGEVAEEDGRKRKRKPQDSVAPSHPNMPPSAMKRPDSSGPSNQPLKLKFSIKSAEPEEALNRMFDKVVSEHIAHPMSFVFCNPVDPLAFPDYHVMIQNPICLEDMKQKCVSLVYRNAASLVNDMQLLYQNCVQYNGPQNPLTDVALGLMNKTRKAMRQMAAEVTRLENEITAKFGSNQDNDFPDAADIEEELLAFLG